MPVKKSLSAKALSQRRICVGLILTVLFACGAHAIAKFWIGDDTSDFVHFSCSGRNVQRRRHLCRFWGATLSAASRVHLSTANDSIRANGCYGLDCD